MIGSDTASVREFITDNETGLLAPMLQPEVLADRILQMLEDTALSRRLRGNARSWAETNLRMETHIAQFEALIEKAVAGK